MKVRDRSENMLSAHIFWIPYFQLIKSSSFAFHCRLTSFPRSFRHTWDIVSWDELGLFPVGRPINPCSVLLVIVSVVTTLRNCLNL